MKMLQSELRPYSHQQKNVQLNQFHQMKISKRKVNDWLLSQGGTLDFMWRGWSNNFNGGGGDSSNKDCFGRKTNLFWESGDFTGNRETWEVFQEIWDIFGTLRKHLIWHVIKQYIYTVICTLCMRCILCILTLENILTPHDMKRPISNVSN